MSTLPLTGGCLCGGVRFEVSAPPLSASYCHCTRCQRRTGAGASANARVGGQAFKITAGEDLIETWRHPDGGAEKAFCLRCGGHLFSRNPDDPAQVGVRLGAIGGDPGIRPTARQFVANAAVWEPIPDDGLERFDAARPG